MLEKDLTEREIQILNAVIQTFIQTAAPAGSRTLARDYDLGVSPATIRNTMSDLAHKGYLTQAHPSAGRSPTDKAYRYYVDTLMRIREVSPEEVVRLERSVEGAALAQEGMLSRAVRALSIVTAELGVGLAPRVDKAVLDKIDLIAVSGDRLLLVLAVRSGPVRTIFVEGSRDVTEDALVSTTAFLNERLAGHSLRDIRDTYRDRLSDAPEEHADLLNIFLEQGEAMFASQPSADDVVLGPASTLASQPEFADQENLKSLIDLTEQRDLLADALQRRATDGIVISIGGENTIAPLVDFSLVTTEYEVNNARGTIGVIGPTRMPYERVVALVEYTSRLLTSLPENA